MQALALGQPVALLAHQRIALEALTPKPAAAAD